MIELAEIGRRGSGSPARRCARRWSGCTSRRPGRDLPQAREPAAHQLVQDPRRDQRHPARDAAERAAGGWSPPVPGTWRRESPGPPASCGVPATIAVPGARAGGQAGRHRAARRQGAETALRRVVAGDRRQPDGRVSRACSCTRSRIRRVMAGNGTIGLEILEDLPDPDAVVDPLRRRRPDRRHRQRGPGAAAGLRRSSPPSPRPAPRWPAALAAGQPADVDYQRLVRGRRGQPPRPRQHVAAGPQLVDGALAIPIAEAAAAVRLLAERAG